MLCWVRIVKITLVQRNGTRVVVVVVVVFKNLLRVY